MSKPNAPLRKTPSSQPPLPAFGKGDINAVTEGLFSLGGLQGALAATRWTVYEEIARLVEIARSEKDAHAMLAMKQLRATAKEILELNGAIMKADATATHNGVTHRRSVRRLIQELPPHDDTYLTRAREDLGDSIPPLREQKLSLPNEAEVDSADSA